MKRLFDALFHDLEGTEYIELRIKRHDSTNATPFLCDSIEQALQHIGKAGEAYHVWFGVAPRSESPGVVRRLPAVWVDIDAKDFGDDIDKALKVATEGVAFKPSALVSSGFGFHAYWFLEESTNPAAARKVLEALHRVTKAGPTQDVTRFLRVPGTVNPKYDPPRKVELVYIDPELRYTISDMLNITKVDAAVLRRICSGSTADFKSRSERDWNVIRGLQIAGVSNTGVQLIFEHRAVGDKYAEETNRRHYLQRTLERAAESLSRIRVATKEAEAEAEAVEGMYEERPDGYWIRGKKPKRVSTFVFQPSRLLSTPDGDVFHGKIISGEREWDDITLPRTAFDRTYNLLKHLTVAHWQWLGTDAQVRQLLPFILQRFDELGGTIAEAVLALGRHDDYWVTRDGLITTNGFIPASTAPVVFLDQSRKYHELQYEDPGTALVDLADAFARLYPLINTQDVTMPMLGWIGAAMIKPLIEEAGFRMPNLSVFGTKGGGKTSIIKLLLRLLGITNPTAVNCRTTTFVLLSMLASATSLPVHLGEFRMDMPESNLKGLRTWLLMQYDSGTDARGRPDQTIVDYPLTAPIILDGEDVFDDPAVRERTLVVALNPEVIREGEDAWTAFLELSEYPIELLALPLVRFTLELTSDWVTQTAAAMLSKTYQAFPTALPDRVRRNVAVALTGWQLLADFFYSMNIEFPPPMAAAFGNAVGEIVNVKTGRAPTQIDEFAVDVVNHAATGGQGFRYKYESDLNVLWVHLATAMSWWYAMRRRTGQTILGTAAVKRQLRERWAQVYPGVGQYIVDIKTVSLGKTTMHAYGLSLDSMVAADLDVPDKLDVQHVLLNVGGNG